MDDRVGSSAGKCAVGCGAIGYGAIGYRSVGYRSVGYSAAGEGVAVFSRQDLRVLEVVGSKPGDMLKGILSGRMPQPLVVDGSGAGKGEVFYSTILTPKGKLVSDLHILPSPSGGFLLVLPEAGLAGAMEHFKKYLHPRFAQIRERVDELAYLSLVGPRAPVVLAGILEVAVDELPQAGEVLVAPSPDLPDLSIMGGVEVGSPAFSLILPRGMVETLETGAVEKGAEPLGTEGWNVLRMEAGRPLFGVDMTPETIPVEAGIHLEAIDYEKGCYIGQEVIIRLRDRGLVNKRLVRILLGDCVPPPPGTELSSAGTGKKAGWVTSSCRSPRFGQTIALGFIKRSVEVGSVVKLGGPQGLSGEVAEL